MQLYDRFWTPKEVGESSRSQSLHLTPTLFRVDTRSAEQSPHSGPFSVKMVSAGRSIYHFPKYTFSVRPGDMLLVPPGERYWTCVNGEGASIRTVYIPTDDLRDAVSALCDPVKTLLEDGRVNRGDITFSPHLRIASPEVREITGELFNTNRSNVSMQSWHQFLGHTALLAADALGAVANIGRIKKSHQRELFRRASLARHLIASDPTTAHSLAYLASIANLSAFYFQRVFRSAFGETPWQMGCRMRIEHAKNLLSCGRSEIETIAARVGYQDHAAFSRAFRRETGLTPLQFRRLHWARPRAQLIRS